MFLLREHPRDMPLRNVSDLMREHARCFRFALRTENQPGVNANEAAGQRECVDLAVAHQEEFEMLPRIGAVRRETASEAVEIVGHLGIVIVAAIEACLAHDTLAQATFLERREVALRGISQIREVLGERAGERSEQHKQEMAPEHDVMIIPDEQSS